MSSEFEVALAVTASTSSEPNMAQEIAAVLERADIEPPSYVILELEKLYHRHEFRRMGEALHRLLSALERTPAGKALARAILGDGGKSLQEDAAEVGTSKQNLHHHVQTTRSRLPI